MDVIKIINIINETYLYAYDMYGFCYGTDDVIKTFTSGFCYDYFCIIKMFFSNAILMMQNDKMHCAALINGEIYDVTGLRIDTENFHEATGCDVEYIYKYYNVLSPSFKEKFNYLVTKNVLNYKNSYVKTLNKTA